MQTPKDPVTSMYMSIATKLGLIRGNESAIYQLSFPSKTASTTIDTFPSWAQEATLGQYGLVNGYLGQVQTIVQQATKIAQDALAIKVQFDAKKCETEQICVSQITVLEEAMTPLVQTGNQLQNAAKSLVNDIEDFLSGFVSSNGSIVYGTDTRLDASSITNPAIKKVVDKVMVMIPKINLVAPKNPKDPWKFASGIPTVRQRLKLCSDDPISYNDQPAAADCSGTCVGDDLYLTAAHCILGNATDNLPAGQDPKTFYKLRSDLFELYIVFDYILEKNNMLPTLDYKSVFQVKEIVDYQYFGGVFDYAVLRLVNVGDPKLKIPIERQAEYVRDNTHFKGYSGTPGVFTIGSPSGAPLKLTGPAQIIDPVVPRTTYTFKNIGTTFGTLLSSTGGNSGGSVMFYEFATDPKANPKVIAIVVGGNVSKNQSDFEFDFTQNCNRTNTIPIVNKDAMNTNIDPETGLTIQGKICIRVDASYKGLPSIASVIDTAKK